jgi:hypothetical protein
VSIVVDTGILFLHALGAFEGGRYAAHALPAGIDRREALAVSAWIGSVMASQDVLTTPQVFAEFKGLARRELNRPMHEALMRSYATTMRAIKEVHVGVEDILTFERDHESWWLCLTDTSVLLASLRTHARLLTVDWPLYEFALAQGSTARHVVEWYYENS